MKIKEIDARGLACPAPVLMTKDAIEKERATHIKVIVDNKASKENVCLFLENRKFNVSVHQEGELFHIIGQAAEAVLPEAESVSASTEKSESVRKKIMVMITSNCIGHGDDELGSKLMVSFLKTLKEMGSELWRLVFVNSGVKLTIEVSEVLPVLKELEENGLHILVCGTCLNHFNLLERKRVGETTNMLDIVTAMQLADKVINI